MRSRVFAYSKSIGVIPFLASLIIILIALLSPQLRRPDGRLLPAAWTVVVVGLAVFLLGRSRGTPWQRSGSLFALALIGQACALLMIFAPNYSVLQHYLPWTELLNFPGIILLAVLFVQTGIVLFNAWRCRGDILEFLRQVVTIPVALAILGFFVLASAYFTWNVGQYLGEVLLASWVICVNLLNLVFVVEAVPADKLKSIVDWLETKLLPQETAELFNNPWISRYPLFAALWVTALSASIAWIVFERIPHIPDSVGYLIQAKYFSAGQLFLPAPPDAAAFALDKLHNDGVSWWNYGFPTWPAVLAIGVLARLPWMVNPILGGVTVLLAFAVIRRQYGVPFAVATVAILAMSPWFLFMSASFMPHPVSVVLVLLALFSIYRARQSHPFAWGLVAGASLGALFLTRPLEALLVGSAIGFWVAGTFGKRLPLNTIAGVLGAGLIVSLFLLVYNDLLTGDPTLTPHQKWSDDRWYPGADRLGFGSDVGNLGWPHLDPIPGHGPLDVVVNAYQNFFNTNIELFGWSFGSLWFVALFILWRRWRGPDWLYLGISFFIVAGHSFYWFSGGPDLGARYWYQLLVPTTVLTVRGIQQLQKLVSKRMPSPVSDLRIGVFVALACLLALINFVPWRGLDKYNHYRGYTANIGQIAEDCEFKNALVFIRAQEEQDFASAMIFNPPALDAPGTIYALDAGQASREAVMRYFADRPVWIIAAAPSRSPGYQLVSWPQKELSVTCAERYRGDYQATAGGDQ